VQVSLDAAPLGVGGRDDARARVLELCHPGGQRGVGVRAEQLEGEPSVQAAQRTEARDPDEEDERSGGDQRQRLGERVDLEPGDPGVVGKRRLEDGREQRPQARAEHDDRDGEREDPERQLEQQEGDVLPGGRVGSSRGHAAPPARPLGLGPVRARDLDSDEPADEASLEVGDPAPRPHRPYQHGHADQRDRHTEPGRDRRDEEAELDDAERQREQHVEDPRVRAGIQDRSDE
jgi:hypothetical protein